MPELLTYLTSFESLTTLALSGVEDFGFSALVIGVFLLGETIIITALILTQQGVLTLGDVIVAAAIGTLLADLWWFIIGRYHPQNIVPERIRRSVLGPTNDTLTSLIRGRYFLALLCLRFFIGTRLMIILYLSRQPISGIRFLLYDLFGTILYLAIFAGIGLLLGQAVAEVFPAYKLTSGIVAGILVVTLIVIVTRNIRRKLHIESQFDI